MIVKAVLAVNPPPSVTVSVMVAVPLSIDDGKTVTVRAPVDPAKTIFAVGTSTVLLEAPVTIKDATGVKSSVSVNASAEVGVPKFTSWLATVVIVGGAFTFKTKLVVDVKPPPSLTVNVIVD